MESGREPYATNRVATHALREATDACADSSGRRRSAATEGVSVGLGARVHVDDLAHHRVGDQPPCLHLGVAAHREPVELC